MLLVQCSTFMLRAHVSMLHEMFREHEYEHKN
jgi:hypothetical protein